MNKEQIAAALIAAEKAALEQWNQGNPSGYLDIYAPNITYFDPFQEHRLDGIDQMRALYESLRGTIRVDRYEMLNPHVEVSAHMAVLTYNLLSYCDEDLFRWNCTEVFQPDAAGEWKIVHNHWSLVQPLKGGIINEVSEAQVEQRLAPDDDLARAISMDELLTGVKEDIRELYKKGK